MTCTLTPGCGHPPHAAHDHPCGHPINIGDPCLYCGTPIATDVNGQPAPCPNCWQPATIADIKTLAAQEGFDTTLTRANG